jgi:hypothetical protein
MSQQYAVISDMYAPWIVLTTVDQFLADCEEVFGEKPDLYEQCRRNDKDEVYWCWVDPAGNVILSTDPEDLKNCE